MKFLNDLIERLKNYILPMLLGAAVAYDIIDCYYPERIRQFTLLFFVAELSLFYVFDWIKNKKLLGSLVYVLMFVAAMVLASNFMRAGYYNTDVWFVNWFYLDRDNAGFVPEYFYAVYVGGGFFIISVLYYFTIIRYRALGTMLCLLFPFVIYAKRAETMSELQIAVLITLFLAIMVHNRQTDKRFENTKTVVNLSYIISIALFVSFVGAVAMLVPKPEVKSVLERNSSAFDLNASDTSDAEADYSNYSNTSSPRFGASYTNEILFYFQSDYSMPVYYLKRQSYDYFENERWHIDTDLQKDKADTRYLALTTYDRASKYNTLRKISELSDYSGYGLIADKFSGYEPEKHNFRVFDDDFKGIYIPAPSGVVAQSFAQSFHNGYYMYGDGEIVVKDNNADYDYTLEYYPETPQYRNFAKNLDLSFWDYLIVLNDALGKASQTDANLEKDITALYDEAVDVRENYLNADAASDRMAQLAEDITKDLTTDYEKAQALSDYFEENDFVYDLQYQPDDESIDYFLFESKTGTCTSYATAMTLMARLSGIPARYVEGFAGYEYTDNGTIAVRDAHAHAYVEVFIPGAGWITFDPTVSGYMADYSQTSNFDFAAFAQYFSRILIFLGVVFFIVFIVLLDRIIEMIFRVHLHFVKGDERIIKLYAHIIRLLEYSSKEKLSAFTPAMLVKYAEDMRGINIEPIAARFEKTCFGGVALSDEEFEQAYSEYKLVYKYLRKLPTEKSKHVAQGA